MRTRNEAVRLSLRVYLNNKIDPQKMPNSNVESTHNPISHTDIKLWHYCISAGIRPSILDGSVVALHDYLLDTQLATRDEKK